MRPGHPLDQARHHRRAGTVTLFKLHVPEWTRQLRFVARVLQFGLEFVTKQDQFVEALFNLRHGVVAWTLGVLVTKFDQDLGEASNGPNGLGR